MKFAAESTSDVELILPSTTNLSTGGGAPRDATYQFTYDGTSGDLTSITLLDSGDTATLSYVDGDLVQVDNDITGEVLDFTYALNGDLSLVDINPQ